MAGMASDGDENGIVFAHWDQGSCGKKGNDHNLGFCGHGGKCPASVKTSACRSGTAIFLDVKKDTTIDDCKYYWIARFQCDLPAVCYRWEEGGAIQEEQGVDLPAGPPTESYPFFCPDMSSLQFKVETMGQSTEEVFYPEIDGAATETWSVGDVSGEWKSSSPSPAFLIGRGNHVLKLRAKSSNIKIRQLTISTIESPGCSKTLPCQFGFDASLDKPVSAVCSKEVSARVPGNAADDSLSSDGVSFAQWPFSLTLSVLTMLFF